ncbi:MAG TPA: YebC/PmpR family DNA-binding transcriptional regulator [Candidatus Marinimicrobia bacterium]|nr:YebC/PmpR family DNA-binding transcriptional regulator [Candidatus Neomarinimicrobiota bacterium]
MSGHSKWSTIKRKKGAQDAKRGKIFTKLIKEIQVAAKLGGGDENANPRLRSAIQAARVANMPTANIERGIKKGTGELEGVNYEEITYEGYGPGGIAIYMEAMTDNKNRTVSEIRHLLTKYGGNLATNGSVAWMFEKKDIITIDKSACNEDDLLVVATDAGANDILEEDDIYELDMDPAVFDDVKNALETNNIPILEASIQMIPKNVVKVDEQLAPKILKIMDALEDHDDIQNVYANFDIDDEIVNKLQEDV